MFAKSLLASTLLLAASVFGETAVEKNAAGCGRCRHESSSSSSDKISECGLEHIKVVVDGGWYPFSFQVPYDPIQQDFYFKSDKLTIVTITDCFCHGDAFQFYDNGVLAGVTSDDCIPLTTPIDPDFACDEYGAGEVFVTPTECFYNDKYCKGGAYLLPGFHNLTLQTLFSPFSGGTAFLRVDTACQTADNKIVACCRLPGGQMYTGMAPGFVL